MINYFKYASRPTPINLAVARILLGLLMLWKLVHYDWGVYPAWPSPTYDILPLFRHPVLFQRIEIVAGICGALVGCVVLGYRLRATALTSAVMLTYLGTVRHAFQGSHTSRILFVGALVFTLFAVFDEDDRITVDQLRRTREMSLGRLKAHLEDGSRSYRHRPLKWGLVLVGLFYFHTGFSKLVYGDPVAWMNPLSLGRYLLFRVGESGLPLREILLGSPTLLIVGALLTITLETAFLPFILAGRRVWPFVVGLVGMHLTIALALGPTFTDQLVFLALFLPWDRLLGRLQRRGVLTVIYDGRCFFHARSLHFFKFLDVNADIEFHGQNEVPDGIDESEHDVEDAVVAIKGAESYRGYRAFVHLLLHVGVAPLAAVLRLPGISAVGESVYDYIAANRSRRVLRSDG